MDPAKPLSLLTRFAEELGLPTLFHSPLDTKLLILARFVRLFAYGSSTLILVAYLTALDISQTRVGIFMTLTLVGDTAISFLLTLVADGLGRRIILMGGALLMVGSGVVFALSGSYWWLLAAAVVGVISPSGNEIGPFRAIEESTLAHLTPAAQRSDIYAWYSLIGTAGSACGMMVTGWLTHYVRVQLEWDKISTYRLVFWGYAVVGAIKFLLAVALSKKCEAEVLTKKPVDRDTETAPLLAGADGGDVRQEQEQQDRVVTEAKKRKGLRKLLPKIGKESRVIVFNLCLLFALDAFASSLAPLAWVAYFFTKKFGLQEGQLGSLFFTTSIIAALSMLVASSIAKRFGNVKTMVFTHLPSAIFLALIPLPSSLPFAMVFLILRACTQSMDVAPRSAFLAAVILPHERTAVMGLINVVKTSASSLGPSITGLLADNGLFWLSFVMAGSLKATYDLGMLAVFAGVGNREEEEMPDEAERRSMDDQERLREGENPEER